MFFEVLRVICLIIKDVCSLIMQIAKIGEVMENQGNAINFHKKYLYYKHTSCI